MIKCIITDDEPIAQEIIRGYTEQIDDIDLVAVCDNALDTYRIVAANKIDVMFLDIEMPEISGYSLLKLLKDPPNTVIISAYPEYAVQGFELEVFDYLVKPVSFDRFLMTIEKLRKKLSANFSHVEETKKIIEDYIFVKHDNSIIKVMINNIVYIEGMENYAVIRTMQNKSYTILTTLKSILPKLPEKFKRVHRSYIINLDFVSSIIGNTIISGEHKIPIGKTFRDEFIEMLNEKSLKNG
jgi:DNA-binding LytR/AlgR family response regulator